MKTIKLETELLVYDSIEELPKEAKDLMAQARDARKASYSPYSNFKVGAAVLLEDGTVIKGSNQENASFPIGQCAERTAIFAAGANHPNKLIKMIAITAGSSVKITKKPVPPCGICRQSIAEYEVKQQQPIGIYFMGEVGEVIFSSSLANILPLVFDNSEL